MTPALLESSIMPSSAHRTMVDAIEAGARADAPLAIFHGRLEPSVLDARSAYAAARKWAQVFIRHGVRRGDRVVLLLPTGPTFVGALLGAMLAGAAAVPLATPMTFGSMEPFLRNLGSTFDSAQARVLVASTRALTAIRTHASSLVLPPVVLTEADAIETVLVPAPLPSLDEADTALIQYTSGTTGRPKGVVISHGALVSNAFAIAQGLEIGPTDVGVSWLPLFHDMGLVGVLLTAVCHPYALHLAAPEYFAMGAERWLRLASEVQATITAAPNFAYEHCVARASKLDADRVALDGLRLALNGAEPVHAETVRRFASALGPFGLRSTASLPVYGMAESTLAVSFAAHGALATLHVERAALEKRGVVRQTDASGARELVSVGTPVAGTSIRIADAAGRTVDSERVGRILIAGASIMDGYFRDDEASGRALADGWLDSGDLGFVSGGQLFVTGRAKEIIIQGGRNVDPHDIEHAVVGGCGLRAGSVAAFGVDDPDAGTERVVLAVETGPKDDRSEERSRAIRGAVLGTLGVRVDDVVFVPLGAIPRTTSGKARRSECARRWASGERA